MLQAWRARRRPRPPDAPADPVRWGAILDGIADRMRELHLVIPDPFSLEEFRGSVERLRGRPLHLVEIRYPAGTDTVCGVCISTRDLDAVFYARTVSDLHGSHIVLHEMAHLILDHRPSVAATRPGFEAAWRDSDGLARTWLARLGEPYDAEAEAEADALAAHVLGRWDAQAPTSWVSASILRAGVRRLSDALG